MTLNTKILHFGPGLGDYGSYSHSLSVNEYKMSSSCFVSKHEELVVSADYCIDPGRVAVAGESAGGTLACFAGACAGHSAFDRGDFLEQDSGVQAVVDLYGIADYTHEPFLPDGRDLPPF